MPRDASETRQRILDAAQAEIMKRGFAATSVDAIQEAADISRGTFFYHFPSKDDLALALLARYAETDKDLVDGFMARAEKLARDPLQQLLVFLILHEEMFEEMEGSDPGCLFASYSYEAGLFDDETHDVIEQSVRHWREVVGDKLRAATQLTSPEVPFDPDELADVSYSILQGAFIMSRVAGDSSLMAAHLRHFRNYLELLFGVAGRDGQRSPAEPGSV